MALDLDAPQFGEQAWHAFTADSNIASESHAHRDRIVTAVTDYLPDLDWRRARLLEVGAYRHYTGHLIEAELGSECVISDLSAAALRDGSRQAERDGIPAKATRVAADFHDFPMSSDCFDAVFVAASVHHTRHPEIVLREMFRMLKPGGILILHNEPCARLCCFHAFASNRPEDLTPFERHLRDAGILATVSSPFGGARPEQLFGMVENDRIPLSLYMAAFADAGEVLERRLSMHGLVGAFEKEILAMQGRGPRQGVEGDDSRSLARCARGVRKRNSAAPSGCSAIACRPSARCTRWRRRSRTRSSNARHSQATTSGMRRCSAARSAPWCASIPEARRDGPMFRRAVTIDADGLVREASTAADPLSDPLLPDLPTCEAGEELEPWFPRSDWQWVHAEDGVRSMVNLAPQCRVDIPPRGERTLLLIRYFAVVTAGHPYRVRVWGAGRLLAEHLIVLQESRLVRAFVPPGCAEILFDIDAGDGAAMDFPWRIRVGVFQQFRAGDEQGDDTRPPTSPAALAAP